MARILLIRDSKILQSIPGRDMQGFRKSIILAGTICLVGVISVLLGSGADVSAGTYLSSAHGNNATYGVLRPDMSTAGYARGNCAHCHEAHASLGGSEPAPAAGPQEYLVFSESPTSQTINFCFNCHGVGGTAYQSGGFVLNRSYSYRAGGWTSDTLNNVEDAFVKSSSHNLADIVSYVDGTWNFISTSNGCAVCHDPHVVQGDPANYPTYGSSAKSSSTRGWVTTRPSQHPTTNLWGDGSGEKTSDYTGNYQAPYRFGSSTTFEPDGSTTQDGSNLFDVNTFCLDCHQNEVESTGTSSANSGTGGGNLTAINWTNTGDKHGQRNADTWISVAAPYSAGSGAVGYVLTCLDCHEPHGSDNYYLLRAEANGTALTGTISSGNQMENLCEQCHSNDWETTHHLNTGGNDRAYDQTGTCTDCHPGGTNQQDCEGCHFHGGITGFDGILQTDYAPTNRQTF